MTNFQTISGRRVEVVVRTPPIQPNLEHLRRAMRVTFEVPMPAMGGATQSCVVLREHRLTRFLEGRHVGLDGVIRDLRLLVCRDCHAVCVRDVSADTLDRLPVGGAGPKRRDLILGWYTGARPAQREFR